MKKYAKQDVLKMLQGGLIVSCQVQHDDPIYHPDIVALMAKAAQWGGAVGIRANMPDQIRSIKAAVDLPVIGLYKQWVPDSDVFITPTLEAAKEVWAAGAEIIALDSTFQMVNGRRACELLPEVKEAIPEAIIFADVSNYEEAVNAVKLGADNSVWARGKLLKMIFFYTCLIACNCCAFNTNMQAFDCASRFVCNLVIRVIAALKTKVIIFGFQINIRQKELVLNYLP